MNTKIESTDQAWEDRQLGASAAHARVASPEHLSALNDALTAHHEHEAKEAEERMEEMRKVA